MIRSQIIGYWILLPIYCASSAYIGSRTCPVRMLFFGLGSCFGDLEGLRLLLLAGSAPYTTPPYQTDPQVHQLSYTYKFHSGHLSPYYQVLAGYPIRPTSAPSGWCGRHRLVSRRYHVSEACLLASGTSLFQSLAPCDWGLWTLLQDPWVWSSSWRTQLAAKTRSCAGQGRPLDQALWRSCWTVRTVRCPY